MKIRLAVSEEKREEVTEFLRAHGIETDDESPFLLSEVSSGVPAVPVKSLDRQRKCFVSAEKIIFIESYGHDVFVHTEEEDYVSSDPLRQFEFLLDPARFTRVSSSCIVSVMHIKEIRPALSRKFTLLLSDGSLVDVTRSYYNHFREQFRL